MRGRRCACAATLRRSHDQQRCHGPALPWPCTRRSVGPSALRRRAPGSRASSRASACVGAACGEQVVRTGRVRGDLRGRLAAGSPVAAHLAAVAGGADRAQSVERRGHVHLRRIRRRPPAGALRHARAAPAGGRRMDVFSGGAVGSRTRVRQRSACGLAPTSKPSRPSGRRRGPAVGPSHRAHGSRSAGPRRGAGCKRVSPRYLASRPGYGVAPSKARGAARRRACEGRSDPR